MKYSCEKIKSMLSLYIDDMLSYKKASYIKQHLETCDDCKHEYELLTALVNEINILPEKPLPLDFEAKLHLALVNASNNMQPAKKTFLQRLKPYSTVAAGLIFILLIGTGYYENFQPVDTAYVNDIKLDDTQDTKNFKKENNLQVAENSDETKETAVIQKPSQQNKQTKTASPNNEELNPKQQAQPQPDSNSANSTPAFEQPPAEAPEDKQAPITQYSMKFADISMPAPTSMPPSAKSGGGTVPQPQEPVATEEPNPKARIAAPEASSGIATFDVQEFKSYIIISDSTDFLNELAKKYIGTKEEEATVFYVDNDQLTDILEIAKKYNAVINIEYNTEGLSANKCAIKQH